MTRPYHTYLRRRLQRLIQEEANRAAAEAQREAERLAMQRWAQTTDELIQQAAHDDRIHLGQLHLH